MAQWIVFFSKKKRKREEKRYKNDPSVKNSNDYKLTMGGLKSCRLELNTQSFNSEGRVQYR